MRAMGVLLLVVGLLATAGCFGWGDDEAAAAVLLSSQPAAYLWSKPYPKLLIEIDHVEGAEPSQLAVDALVEMLRGETNKRSIEVVPYSSMPRFTSATSEKRWTVEELVSLAAETLDHAPPGAYGAGDTAVLHVLYLDGEYVDERGGVRGLAIGPTAILFKNPSPVGAPANSPIDSPAVMKPLVERKVLIHEVGHVLGLVDLHIPMVRPHNDPADPDHSANPKSVMRAGVDLATTLFGQVDPDSETPYQFDEDDKADLRAFREREPKGRP